MRIWRSIRPRVLVGWQALQRFIRGFRRHETHIETRPPVLPPPRARRIHLGVDYGTSWSKLVFRDYEAAGSGDRSFIVRPTQDEGGNGDYRIPSTVALLGGRLWFGWQAARLTGCSEALIYHSIKVRMAMPDHFHGKATPLPREVDSGGLATLTVLYLLQRGRRAAAEYLRRYDAVPRLSMTIGVPMSDLDNPHLRARFLDVARRAHRLLRNEAPDLILGIDLTRAAELLRLAASATDAQPSANPAQWLRAEAAAGLLWAFRSPAVPPGLYAAVDVGAGTTSANVFRITDRKEDNAWYKHGMAFFGAACLPPGADAVDEAIAGALRISDPALVRGRENELIHSATAACSRTVEAVADQVFVQYRTAFGRAYDKDRRQSAWYGMKLFLLGGGSEITVIQRSLRRRVWAHLEADPQLMDPGTPSDLLEANGELYKGPSTFLFVAYGLSHLAADVPEAIRPGQIPAFQAVPARTFEVDVEDIY